MRALPVTLSMRLGLICLAAMPPGCASKTPPATFEVSAGGYAQAFESAKDVLRDAAFELDRVDARDGVIVTAPRQWAGAATPWIPHSTGMRSSLEGLSHHERRYARVVFEPVGGATAGNRQDLREFDGKVSATVEVVVERVYRPGRRVSAAGIRLTSTAVDPAKVQRRMQPQFIEEHGRDPELAARLSAKMSAAAAEPVDGSAPAAETGSGDRP